MDLREYLTAHDLSQRDLARRANIDEAKFSRILRGEMNVMPEVALALFEATGREVSLEDILRLSVKQSAF